VKLPDLVDAIQRKGWTTQSRPRPTEGSPRDWDPYPIDWEKLPRGQRLLRDDNVPLLDQERWRSRWQEVADQIEQSRQRSATNPLPPNVDALAWYLPFHRYGMESGIYIREDAVLDVAGRIKYFSMTVLEPVLEAKQLIHQALAVLFFHEMFHHRIECFATRLEVVKNQPVYLPYEEKVFLPSLGSDLLLEEAFACADMIKRLGEKRYASAVHKEIRSATKRFLYSWIPQLEPGYRLGVEAANHGNLGEVLSQVADCTAKPMSDPHDWDLAPDMTRSFFHVGSITKVIVAKGATPTIPWLDTSF
jgi:hypothetical protein